MTDESLENKRKERAEDLEERRLTRAELLAAQAARTQLALEAHERHFERINGHIEGFSKQILSLEKQTVEHEAEARSQIKMMTALLAVMMFLASAGSILVQIL